MISMLFMSLYFIIDDIFIGKILGVKALAAAGLIMPFIMISFSIIDIIAVGSSVQISLHLVQKDYKKASGIFSFSLIFVVMVSMLFFVLGILSLEWLCLYFIDNIELANLCIEYARIYILFYPFVALYFAIDDYLRIAKKPIYSMILNLIVAIINLVLDYLFLAVFDLGLYSATLATCIGMSIGVLLGLAPFVLQNLNLKISKIYINLNLIKNIILNGSSGFLVSTFSSVFMIVANAILLEISTENSVAILSVLMSVEFFASSFIMGMYGGISPLFSYHFATKNMRTFKGLLKITFLSAALISFSAFVIAEFWASSIISLFNKDTKFVRLGSSALMIFGLVFLCGWFVEFSDTVFTSINKPIFSLILAIFGDFLSIPLIFILVYFLGVNGVWISMFVAKFIAGICSIIFWKKLQIRL
ncbi:MATE family efflux transporter [Campylobacter hyointestinalis]|uniref:MATE family efflux transporter n=1 Tax=Campylobacter hyointestinalis TaxID=198 RepID=UPI00072583D6|nr:MATE family efflux transporter [Campylobacter hyointestinalis]CUU75636.1 putative integral membrane protein [Campylobacter hyointestinalis subsp. hyointestinalis]CUU79144.1 putative integral membrane protein [Campylobacter hyointestinalis subsp. hyointestinalis]